MESKRIALSTGVSLNVAMAGAADGKPVILLHGFPESHRTWRKLAPLLGEFQLVMPDLRGFAGSDKPQNLDAYRTDVLVADLLALADAMEIERFALVGHDWGGAVAWAATLRGGPRIERLAIINSPHPLIFQKSIIDDEAQRAASQYIRSFRETGMEEKIRAMGLDAFFDKSFGAHVDLGSISAEERKAYLEEWGGDGALEGMLAWYRASPILVPAMDEAGEYPAWLMSGVPDVHVPVKILWGMEDKALLPCQLEGLDGLIDDLSIERLEGVGHFAPWEAADKVAAALKPFLAKADL
ncbi:alpha/beta fold hydrolase [Sphingomicrobium lutaoense]|uniref:Pimeloyl-ACP methyl ester carboxylesterase n=1 Tax=Sphingomicrobium lutaoense TaxID=515949 RepID=A0A839Z3D8_9SPHN|nr:alpha/beta hydrolase [Sphingomicrobium lutaoense]MBB3764597.1 pimeloyl-ACP methyl ester carboxylesterase [Sphingomicrobium lutaoense]